MSCIPAIRAILLADPVLAPALGERIRPGSAQEVEPRPYCLLWTITETPIDALSGPTGLSVATIQIDLYADSYEQRTQLARRITKALGDFGRGKIANTVLSSILRTAGPREFFQRIGAGADQVVHTSMTDYRVHYRPAG